VNPTHSTEHAPLLPHGAAKLPSINIDSYSVALEDDGGPAGDRANKSAFTRILQILRESLRKFGEDPLGTKPTQEISRKKLDSLMTKGEASQAALIQSAIEDFAHELRSVIKRFLKLKSWQNTECVVVGGGFRASRIGELAIARAHILLKTDGVPLPLELLEGDPDEAGLIGAAHLLPAWMLKGHDAMLAADIGGTNFRVGIVELNLRKAKNVPKPQVVDIEHWCHADEKDIKRDSAIERLATMLTHLAEESKKSGLRLAPVIGIGCPGVIQEDGTIKRGAQNLPGNWEAANFHLPDEIRTRLPRIGEHPATVILHNDAVVQGLSQLPRMRRWRHWGILTIGTGLGNARFTARPEADD
jgi:predicted NBD/HSP70 family sugar kinase